MKKILISFANKEWYQSQYLLCKSAKRYGFDGYINYTEKNLDKSFIEKNSLLFKDLNRGYGFWSWKSFIIRDTLDMVNDGDIVFYVDSGNLIINDVAPLLNIITKKDIALFVNRDGNYEGKIHHNSRWTKRDCFVMMDCDEDKYYTAKQINGSYIGIKKTNKNINLMDEYLKFSQNVNIITDVPNITKENLKDFEDHRHDQSILSLLAKKHNIDLSPDPSEWGNNYPRNYNQIFMHHRNMLFWPQNRQYLNNILKSYE